MDCVKQLVVTRFGWEHPSHWWRRNQGDGKLVLLVIYCHINNIPKHSGLKHSPFICLPTIYLLIHHWSGNMAALCWAVLLLVLPGLSHEAAVSWKLDWGWVTGPHMWWMLLRASQFSFMWLLIFQQARLDFSTWCWKFSKRAKGKLQELLKPRLWGLTQCHFCHILLVKTSPRTSPDARGWETDSTSCCEEQQNHCNVSRGTRGTGVAIFANKVSHMLEKLSVWYQIKHHQEFDRSESEESDKPGAKIFKAWGSSKWYNLMLSTSKASSIFIVSSVNASEFH